MARIGTPVPGNPYAWSTEPMPAAPHPAVTPLDNIMWRSTPLIWDTDRFHQVIDAWLDDREHLHALLTDKPAWCESRRPADYAVANLIHVCITPRLCVEARGAGSIGVIAAITPGARSRRYETVANGDFAAEAMRVLLPRVLRACLAVSQASVPIVIDGVPGVWIGASAPACDTEHVPAAWGTMRDAECVRLAAQVVHDLHAEVATDVSWMDLLGRKRTAMTGSVDARRAAKVAQDDIIRALQNTGRQ